MCVSSCIFLSLFPCLHNPTIPLGFWFKRSLTWLLVIVMLYSLSIISSSRVCFEGSLGGESDCHLQNPVKKSFCLLRLVQQKVVLDQNQVWLVIWQTLVFSCVLSCIGQQPVLSIETVWLLWSLFGSFCMMFGDRIKTLKLLFAKCTPKIVGRMLFFISTFLNVWSRYVHDLDLLESDSALSHHSSLTCTTLSRSRTRADMGLQ